MLTAAGAVVNVNHEEQKSFIVAGAFRRQLARAPPTAGVGALVLPRRAATNGSCRPRARLAHVDPSKGLGVAPRRRSVVVLSHLASRRLENSFRDFKPYADIEPTVTWGITPAQSLGVSQAIPSLASYDESERTLIGEALEYMSLEEGQSIEGTKIDVAFVGSCTNGRISDLREAAAIAKGNKVADGVKALIVPGSQIVAKQAEEEGLDKIFIEAGFQWRAAGCSMCLAMNPDKLQGREVCASSSNRNFKGRQGSPTGRTLLMSPAMVAAAAINGCVTDVRKMLEPAMA